MLSSPRLQVWLPVTSWVAVHAQDLVAETVVARQVVVVASRTLLPLELLLLPERKSLIDTRNLDLILAAATIPVTAMRKGVAPTNAARAFQSTSTREWLPWGLENKKKTVAATAGTIARSIIGSTVGSIGTIVGRIGTIERDVTTGDIDTTTTRIQMRKAIITTGTRDGAKAREM